MDKMSAAVEAVRSDEQRAEAVGEAKDSDFSKPVAWFTVDVIEPSTGRRFAGKFLAAIPTIDEREEIYLAVSRRTGGLPWASLPDLARTRLEMLATFPIVLRKRPEWFNAPGSFRDQVVPEAVYGRILDYFQEFFRPRADSAGGSEESALGDRTAP